MSDISILKAVKRDADGDIRRYYWALYEHATETSGAIPDVAYDALYYSNINIVLGEQQAEEGRQYGSVNGLLPEHHYLKAIRYMLAFLPNLVEHYAECVSYYNRERAGQEAAYEVDRELGWMNEDGVYTE